MIVSEGNLTLNLFKMGLYGGKSIKENSAEAKAITLKQAYNKHLYKVIRIKNKHRFKNIFNEIMLLLIEND